MTYEVGYKRPPKAAQFKKGASGNPKGRPKGQPNLKTDLLAELSETVRISEGGSQRSITKQRALLKSLTAKAIGGDMKATDIFLRLVQKHLSEEQESAPSAAPLSITDQEILDDFLKSSIAQGSAKP